MRNLLYFIIGLLAFSSCKSKEGISKVNEDVCESKVLNKNELMDLLYNKDLKDIQFIDIRDPHKFAMGHLPNAINMPMHSFFKEEGFEKINPDAVLILYGEDGSTAKMVGLMAGHFTKSEFYSLGGGYKFIKERISNGLGVHSGLYNDEEALVDFKEMSEEIRKRSNLNGPAKVKKKRVFKKPLVRRKKKSVSGGCG